MRKTITGATLSAMLLAAMTAQAGPAPADKCEASKNKTAGTYYSCRQKAESTAISKATSPDYSKCSAKFDANWDKAEADGDGMCPDTVLTAPMNAYLAAQAAEAALVISGVIPSIPDCAGDLATCEGDLTTCGADLAACEAAPAAPTLKTGQTNCYDVWGTPIACAGTGQDGDLQRGAARSFTDNLDGTITDNATGLMWEKLSDDGSIHDWDATEDWTTAVTTKVATLNSTAFAGHGDWRLPNRNELLTIVNIGAVMPATFSVFSDACTPGCTVTTCSCTQSSYYWSSSAYSFYPDQAWLVGFVDGGTVVDGNIFPHLVRAVRAGS